MALASLHETASDNHFKSPEGSVSFFRHLWWAYSFKILYIYVSGISELQIKPLGDHQLFNQLRPFGRYCRQLQPDLQNEMLVFLCSCKSAICYNLYSLQYIRSLSCNITFVSVNSLDSCDGTISSLVSGNKSKHFWQDRQLSGSFVGAEQGRPMVFSLWCLNLTRP